MMGSKCAYCQKWLLQNACKGGDGQLYCSVDCCERANPRDDTDWNVMIETLVKLGALETWWVCRMKGGGYFAAGSPDKPDGLLDSDTVKIAAGSYDVVYGPCTRDEAVAYIDDVE